MLWVGMILSFSICILGATRVKFIDDINRMIPHDASIEAMNDVLSKTKTGEQVIFTMSLNDTNVIEPDSLIILQQQLQASIEKKLANSIKHIQSQTDDENELQFTQIVLQYLPLFLTVDDYVKIDSLLKSETINATLEKEHKLLLSPAGVMAKQWIAQDPVGIVPIALDKLKSLNYNPNYQLYNGYIFDKNQQQLNFFLELQSPSSATGINQDFFLHLDNVLHDFKLQHKNINVSYFGAPAVAAANAAQMRSDTILTLCITIALLLLLTFYVFRRKRAPFILLLPVVFGAVFGMAITALVQSEVSIIALGAGAIILGIAIDFSIHFMSHARIHTNNMRDNVRSLVFPLTLGAFTTIGAFFALRFCHTPLLQDLGLFASASLAGASLFTLVFLPHLLKNKNGKAYSKAPITFIDKIATYSPEKNKWLLMLVLIATPILWHFAKDVQFDSDLMHLNYLSPELKIAQDELNKKNDYALSSLFVVAKDNNENAAIQKLESASPAIQNLTHAGKIRNAIVPVTIIPSNEEQQRRLQLWKNFWAEDQIKRTLSTVDSAAKINGFSSDAFTPFATTLMQEYTPFDSSTKSFLKELLPASWSVDDKQSYVIAALKVAPGARSDVLQILQQNKNVTVTDRQSVAEKLLSLLNKDFNKVLLYSGLLVFFTLLLAYGRIELALISFLPMALTWVWILGIMSLLGLKFNIVNIIISTLIFGLGDDYSIFMMDSLMEKYRKGKTEIAHARSAVYLSVITTIIGLGTLIFAKHPALHSIAVIAIVGLVCVVFVSQILQPFLFNFMIQHRADKGFMPFTLWSFLKSSFSFLYFFVGCLLVTLSGFVLIGLMPFGKAKSKYIFHTFLSKYTGSVMYVMANVTKRIYKQNKTLFDKPAVYVANHSSFLDILLTTMLHPKLVLLTNRWVWRSPAFGKIVKMAEYYPVADGAEESLEHLQDLVNRGYGIIVFPEGTRSTTDKIHRFHKGAFYIAEKLKLDIIPILLHGVHYTMQKGDWLLKDGTTTVKMYPAIIKAAELGENNYSITTKKTLHWFRATLQDAKIKKETPRYFYEQLTKGNLYKGPVLEWYCKVKVRLENCYETFHQLLPRNGLFYDLGCGNGFMTLMLHWAAEQRQWIGVDYDEEKIINARNHYARNAHAIFSKKAARGSQYELENPLLRFVHNDVTTFKLQPCNGIIISDVLHYLLPNDQQQLLNKCYDALLPNGILILRDGVEELSKRHKGTKLTEKLSTQIFKFNKTHNELHFITRKFIEDWAREKNLAVEIIDNTKKTSNLIFVLRKT